LDDELAFSALAGGSIASAMPRAVRAGCRGRARELPRRRSAPRLPTRGVATGAGPTLCTFTNTCHGSRFRPIFSRLVFAVMESSLAPSFQVEVMNLRNSNEKMNRRASSEHRAHEQVARLGVCGGGI